MLLFKNRNGIVMAADTRYTKPGTPTLINENGRKIVFDANAKICISMVGVNSYNTTKGEFYLQHFLQDFITNKINNCITTLQNSAITLDKFIFAFLKWLLVNNYLTDNELANFNTDLTGIILRSNNTVEIIDVNIAHMHSLLSNSNQNYVISQLPIVCEYKTYQKIDLEVITGGDHLLSWISGKGVPPPLSFIADYKATIINYTIYQLRDLAINTINALIANNSDPFVGPTIGGNVDYIIMDYNGHYNHNITSNDQAFKNLRRDVLSINDWHQ
jgi:hypothetical protein